jgi:Holliday junction DNA helicase RuvA
MIGRLTGLLLEKNPPLITLDVHGVGYEVDVPMSTFYNLPAVGERTTLFTHMVVREDGQFLYGFLTEEERATFRQLLKISGIGARTALAVLSGLSAHELAQAVVMREVGRLIKIPGIGKKTAERLLLELRDKLPKISGSSAVSITAAQDAGSDILNALLALGYSDREAQQAMKLLPEGASVSDGIRQALKSLSKA